jgi:hypothetical protein
MGQIIHPYPIFMTSMVKAEESLRHRTHYPLKKEKTLSPFLHLGLLLIQAHYPENRNVGFGEKILAVPKSDKEHTPRTGKGLPHIKDRNRQLPSNYASN